jgi:hypothetical protein
MIGVESIEPNTPPFEIENVPPVSSSIVSLPSCARLPNSVICFSMSASESWSALRAERAPEILSQIRPQFAYWSSVVGLKPA